MHASLIPPDPIKHRAPPYRGGAEATAARIEMTAKVHRGRRIDPSITGIYFVTGPLVYFMRACFLSIYEVRYWVLGRGERPLLLARASTWRRASHPW